MTAGKEIGTASPGAGSPHIFDQSGIVVSVRTWSETDVSGVVWSNGGHISSSRTDILQIFLQQEDGREVDLKINNTVIGARVGNYLSIVWAKTKDSDGDVGVALVNHSTGRYEIFSNRLGRLMGNAMVSLNGCFFSVIAIIATLIFGSFLGELKSILITLAVLAIPVSFVVSASKTKGQRRHVRQAYGAAIEAYVRNLMAREKAEGRPSPALP
jgi:hypothetical protein